MKPELLDYLLCPLSGQKLTPTIIKAGLNDEIEVGYLQSPNGLIFPIIKGIPRMLLESFIDHAQFFKTQMPGFGEMHDRLMKQYGKEIRNAVKRNKATKKSFSFEWSLLNANKNTRIWEYDKDSFRKQLFDELNLPGIDMKDMLTIDVGCGHGQSTYFLAQEARVAIGMDLGLSVEYANENYKNYNLHYVQADLHHPPFLSAHFNVVYSSGVLHHTPATRNAFDITSLLCAPGGIYCVWLYHPFRSLVHQLMLAGRMVTVRLPLRFQFWLYFISLVPLHKFISWLKGKPKSWREIMINLLDILSPRYRHEHTHEEVEGWFSKNHFKDIKLTTTGKMGFSMRGTRAI